MDWILFIRLIIFITFLLLLTEGIAAVIIARRFVARYLAQHLELEKRVEATERRLRVLEGIT